MRVAVIGGGPSGLVQLKVLIEAHQHFPVRPIEVRLFEANNKVGGVFSSHSYEEAELVSSKFLTAFSDFRPRKDEPDFFSSDRYVEYLEEYASHFRLWPYIHLGTKVMSVRRGLTAGHLVTHQTRDGQATEWECDAVAVCSGLHALPHIPDLPGLEHVPVVMHSQDFKSREQFGKDATVMVLGCGETGADICYLALTGQTKRVILCHRDGWLGAPKRVPGQRFLPWLLGAEDWTYPQLPLDSSQVTLFDSMYVHPIVRDSMIVWNFYHVLALPVFCWLCGGSPFGVDQFIGQLYGERYDASRVFFNKAWQRISNYASYPWRPKEWHWATRIKNFFFRTEIPPPPRTLDVAPFPSHVSADGEAHFPLTSRPESERARDAITKPDVVIHATGYLPHFFFLNAPANADKKPYPRAFDADVRQIWKADDPTVGFIGFVRPGFGAIPPLAEMQAMLFTMNILGRVPEPLDPEDEWHYRIIAPPDARVTYGVEHDSYAYQLAKDMHIAPSFTEVLRIAVGTRQGWRLPYIWAAGAAFNAKFRMRGPWKWHGAAEVLTGELWQTITRREGLFGNAVLSIPPLMILGAINLYFFLYAHFWRVFAKLNWARPLEIRNEPKRIIAELAWRHEKGMETRLNGLGNNDVTLDANVKRNGKE